LFSERIIAAKIENHDAAKTALDSLLGFTDLGFCGAVLDGNLSLHGMGEAAKRLVAIVDLPHLQSRFEK
jgi:hypothetical protein